MNKDNKQINEFLLEVMKVAREFATDKAGAHSSRRAKIKELINETISKNEINEDKELMS